MSSLAALLLLPLALVAGTVVLVLLRLRALRRPLPPGFDPRAPLAHEARIGLLRWERRLRSVAALVVATYLVAIALALTADPEPGTGPGLERSGATTIALVLLGLFCALGAWVQFSERCPRCGYNLGFQSRLFHLEACERCGGRWS